MDIRLLGEFGVSVGGRPVTPASRAEAELLAFLALQPGRVVDADRLIEALWGETLPANPANALQLRVSKLRRGLAQAGIDRGVVVTRPPGYLLDIPAESVDVARFRLAVTMARSLAAAGDAHGALPFYRTAAAEWRDEALVSFPDRPWAEEEARRLESFAVTASEERLQLEIDGGHHGEVLDELTRLVELHPLRERLHGLRMIALYRSGRQAEALDAYQQARAVLEEELGLDPSRELRALETAILQHDPTIAGEGDARRHRLTVQPNLPAARHALLGRDGALAELTELLHEHRLITLTGPGGGGKTTLGTELARRCAGAFPDGAWFVSLANIAGASDLAAIVADTFGLPPAELLPGESSHDRLARQLATRTALLVLDNCEHVIDGAAGLVDRLLAGCPGLKVIATSREALATAGEVQYALGPLAVPPPDADIDTIGASAAVQLFCERAAAAGGDRPVGEDLRTVAEICRELDGIPLAIELAAARTKMLPLGQIAARLEDRFALLTSGSRTADRRHQTLHATIDWSHQLLDHDEQTLLRRLAVFRGTFPLEVAEDVCSGASLPADAVFDALAGLVDRSLVIRTPTGDYRLLETVRAFAREQLRHAGEEDVVEARNLDRLQRLVDEAAPRLRGQHQRSWMDALRAEEDGIRAALVFCARHPDRFGPAGMRLAAGLGWYWYLGDHEEGRRQLHRLLQVCDVEADPHGYAQVLEALSYVERPSACVVHPSERCADAAARSGEQFAATGDELGVARSLVLTTVEAVRGTGSERALADLDVAEAVFEGAGEAWWSALVAFVRMEILIRTERTDDAVACGREAARRFEALGDHWGISAVHGHLGHNLTAVGRYDEALEAGRRSLEVARAVGLANSVQMMAAEVGLQLLATGDEPGAEAEFAAARTVAQRYGYLTGDGVGAAGQGFLARHRGNLDEAVSLYGEGIALLTEAGSTGYLPTVYTALGYVHGLEGRDLEATAAHRRAFEVARAFPDPGLVATAWEGQARVALAQGDADRSVQLLAAATALRERTHRPVPPPLAIDVAQTTEAVRTLTGEPAFVAILDQARAAGPRLAADDELLVGG